MGGILVTNEITVNLTVRTEYDENELFERFFNQMKGSLHDFTLEIEGTDLKKDFKWKK